MRKIREILRLKYEVGLADRQISMSVSLARSTISDYLARARISGLGWPLPEDMDDTAIERLLFPPPVPFAKRPLPNFVKIHTDLKGKGVTLLLLWQEYKMQNPEGYQYTSFCNLYREWSGKLTLSMRQVHRAGEKMFVDYSGLTVEVIDPATGEIREAEIFVSVLGASSYTYAEATWTQSLPDWIGSHVRAFTFYGGVTEIVVPDNLRSGVSKPCRYDPDINPTYQEMAEHYGTAVMPARVRKPKDKSKVEAGVLLVERWILARLRNQAFFSLSELNEAIRELLEALNKRPFKKLPGSRRSMFEELDRSALKPLPAEVYEYAEWKKPRVNIDYHVEVDGHYYSVPYRFVREQVSARITSRTVEIFRKGQRICSHMRSKRKGSHTTLKEHMPKSHQKYLEWTPARLINWAEQTGTATSKLVASIMESRSHPQQGFRACLGVMRLTKEFGSQRLEAACSRALYIRSPTYRSVKSILKNGLDRQQELQPEVEPTPIEHPNIRGSDYYH